VLAQISNRSIATNRRILSIEVAWTVSSRRMNKGKTRLILSGPFQKFKHPSIRPSRPEWKHAEPPDRVIFGVMDCGACRWFFVLPISRFTSARTWRRNQIRRGAAC